MKERFLDMRTQYREKGELRWGRKIARFTRVSRSPLRESGGVTYQRLLSPTVLVATPTP